MGAATPVAWQTIGWNATALQTCPDMPRVAPTLLDASSNISRGGTPHRYRAHSDI